MKKRNSLTMRTILLICMLLLVVGAVLSIVLTAQAKGALRAQIEARMLDTANVAAAHLDGDSLEALRTGGKESPEFQAVLSELTVFLEHITLDYIYVVADAGDGNFIFLVDSDPDSPGQLGDPVVYTDALYAASRGTASVDTEPYEDMWGSFYSAYSPIFNSRGEVAGVVAADFSAQWYEAAIGQLQRSALNVCMVSLIIAALIIFILAGRLQNRLDTISEDLEKLSGDLDDLIREIPIFPHEKQEDEQVAAAPPAASPADEIGVLSEKIRSMQKELQGYIVFARATAYMDVLTGMSNQSSYLERVKQLNQEIEAKTAAFTVFIIDLNGLKNMNDDYGHDAGDAAIIDAANVIRAAFPAGELFRIGGDEFAVLLHAGSEEEISARKAAMDEALGVCNQTEKSYGVPLSFSKGAAVFDPARDKEYMDVFRRADQAMYQDKAAFYARNGDRRRR